YPRNPQEDDMLRDVMEGNAAHIEPSAVFAREMQAAGFTPAGNWDATDEVIPSSTLIKRLWRWVELVAPIASRLKLVPQSYVTHGGAAAGQLHLFQKRVLSYRVMLATKWRLPPQDECSVRHDARNLSRVQVVDRHAPDNTGRSLGFANKPGERNTSQTERSSRP